MVVKRPLFNKFQKGQALEKCESTETDRNINCQTDCFKFINNDESNHLSTVSSVSKWKAKQNTFHF